MKMRLLATGCVLAGALCMCAAQDINPLGPKKGNYALGFSFDYFKPENSSSMTMLNVDPEFFVTDNIGLRVPFSWGHTSGSDSTFIGGGIRYYFNEMGNKQLRPFVGAGYGVFHSTGNSDTTSWEVEGGAHYFLANNVAVTGALQWQRNRQSGVNSNDWDFSLGFTIFFGK